MTMLDHVGETVRVRIGERGSYRWVEGILNDVDERLHVCVVGQVTVPNVDVLLVDLDGYNYRIDEHLGPWRMTCCCGASAKGMEDGIGCRSCYGEITAFEDGPARLDGDTPREPSVAYIVTLPADKENDAQQG